MGRSTLKNEELCFEKPAVRPEFKSVPEAEVWKAIAEAEDGHNAVAMEVMRIALGYLAEFKRQAESGKTSSILHVSAGCAVEKVALLLAVRFLEVSGGTALPIVFAMTSTVGDAVEGMRKGSFRGAPENSSCGGSLRMTRDSVLCWRVGVSRRGGNLPRPGVPPAGGNEKGGVQLP